MTGHNPSEGDIVERLLEIAPEDRPAMISCKDSTTREMNRTIREAAAEITRLRELLRISPAMEGWQDIETAPKDEPVLVYCPDAQAGTRRRCHVDTRLERYNWRWAHCRPAEWPTHWMPLPPSPKGMK